MCGIAGITGNASGQRIRSMVSAMRHRGPDDSGVFIEDGVALGMARLAIIDVTPAGHQPMHNADRSLWMVYNGETYNFREERENLEKKGHVFTSHSDTEVVLRMYEVYGDDFLLRMRGIFALAIYDRRKGPGRERLLLARDHLGIKPLLYCKAGTNFIFASEIKAMLASGLIEREVDPEALRLLLTCGSVPQPLTVLRGVHMLPAGSCLVRERGSERVNRFWKLGTNRVTGLEDTSYEELVAAVRSSLVESVRLQMMSDVPLGAFLSGGVDSSLLVALMAGNSARRIKTFSVGFEAEGAYMDETDAAGKVAAVIGTDHTRVLVTGSEVRDRISQIASALDQPSVDGVNSYFVSMAARRRVSVAISGTGGDELFAGYPWFITMSLAWQKERRHPFVGAGRRFLGSVLQGEVFDRLASGRLGTTVDRVRSWAGFVSRYSRIYRIFDIPGTASVLAPEMRSRARTGREQTFDMMSCDELAEAGPVERVSALCLRGYTQNQLLRDIDAVSMAHSLEVRVPFLDPVVLDLALSLPEDAKLGGLSGLANPEGATYRETGTKKILIDAGKGLLPEGLDLQPKRGFSMPFDTWIRGPLRDVLEDTLSKTSVRRRGFFDEGNVERVKTESLSGQKGWARPWLLMMTELWCREVLDGGKPMSAEIQANGG